MDIVCFSKSVYYIGGPHMPHQNQLVGVLVVVPVLVVVCIRSFCPTVTPEMTSMLASSVVPRITSV